MSYSINVSIDGKKFKLVYGAESTSYAPGVGRAAISRLITSSVATAKQKYILEPPDVHDEHLLYFSHTPGVSFQTQIELVLHRDNLEVTGEFILVIMLDAAVYFCTVSEDKLVSNEKVLVPNAAKEELANISESAQTVRIIPGGKDTLNLDGYSPDFQNNLINRAEFKRHSYRLLLPYMTFRGYYHPRQISVSLMIVAVGFLLVFGYSNYRDEIIDYLTGQTTQPDPEALEAELAESWDADFSASNALVGIAQTYNLLEYLYAHGVMMMTVQPNEVIFTGRAAQYPDELITLVGERLPQWHLAVKVDGGWTLSGPLDYISVIASVEGVDQSTVFRHIHALRNIYGESVTVVAETEYERIEQLRLDFSFLQPGRGIFQQLAQQVANLPYQLGSATCTLDNWQVDNCNLTLYAAYRGN